MTVGEELVHLLRRPSQNDDHPRRVLRQQIGKFVNCFRVVVLDQPMRVFDYQHFSETAVKLRATFG